MGKQGSVRQRSTVVMSDVAKRAGVSPMTVSRVLDGRSVVAPQTRERVLEAIRELDYSPNAAARALAAGKTRLVGLATFDSMLQAPSTIMFGFQQAARDAGFEVANSAFAEATVSAIAAAIARLEAQSVDGLAIYAPHLESSVVESLVPKRIPTILMGTGGTAGIQVVTFDQVEAASIATQHLLDLGHRSIWHIAGPKNWPRAKQRELGWRNALAEVEGSGGRLLRCVDWSPRSGYEQGLRLANQHSATAVFVASDRMALGVLRALSESGVRVPEHVSVVGFDAIPDSQFYSPSLTTVIQDHYEWGRSGFNALLDVMDHRDPRPGTFDSPRLVIRQSTAPPKA